MKKLLFLCILALWSPACLLAQEYEESDTSHYQNSGDLLLAGYEIPAVLPAMQQAGSRTFIGTSITIRNTDLERRGVREIEITGGLSSDKKNPGGIIEITARW